MGGIAHKVFEITSKEDLEKINLYAEYVHKPLVIIGLGSNSIFAETTDKYIIGLMKMTGIEIVFQIEKEIHVRAYAGEIWDDLVKWTVEHELSGIEALSGIPGTVGASPIQNIGAYGSDISQTFVEAEVFDRTTKEFKTLSHEHCCFTYRDSIFKQNPKQYIIISVTFKLHTTPASIPQYKDVQEYFKQNQNPSLIEIRNAIIEIRNRKIPDYKTVPNCGSFFKNPIITKEHLEQLRKTYPTIPSFELSNSLHKVYAGWLIEHIDYQSAQTEAIIFNQTNKLVLINQNNGTFDELQLVLDRITHLAQEAYGITLEPEPNIFN